MIHEIAFAVFLSALILLILYGIYCLFTPRKKKNEPEQSVHAPQDINAPAVIGSCVVKYDYQNVAIRPQIKRGYEKLVGEKVTLESNSFDSVDVYVDDALIGVLEQPTICSVSREWLKTGEPYLGYVTHADNEERELSISIMFYRDELSRYLKSQPDAPEFKVMGSRGEDAQLALIDTNVGEKLTLDIDPDKNRYALYNVFGNCVGYPSASATKLIEEKGEEGLTLIVSDKQLTGGLFELRFRIFE